jgi:hypothetical protein
MIVRHPGGDVRRRGLFADPTDELLKRRIMTQLGEFAVRAFEVLVLEQRVHLLMARAAHRHAVLGLSAPLARQEMMLRDHLAGHQPAAQGAIDLAKFAHESLLPYDCIIIEWINSQAYT